MEFRLSYKTIPTYRNRVQKYPTSAFPAEIWEEIESIFWRHEVPCLPRGAACDGLDPLEIETTKRGVEIHGGIWFLTGGRGSPSPRFEVNLCLSRPRFSSIESVTVERLRTAVLFDSALEDGLLWVTVA